MIPIATLWLSLALGGSAGSPECASPPPRISDAYWSYIDACGCAKLDPPARASLDYDRFQKACSAWREKNAHTVATTRPSLSAQTCGTAPPSRGSEAYWDFIDACGCSNLDPPSRASADHDRFLKACGEARVSEPEASPAAKPRPSPSSKPSPKP